MLNRASNSHALVLPGSAPTKPPHPDELRSTRSILQTPHLGPIMQSIGLVFNLQNYGAPSRIYVLATRHLG
jgi:hypothetical protein